MQNLTMNNLFMMVLNSPNISIISVNREINSEGVSRIVLNVKPSEDFIYRCSVCGRICQRYDKLDVRRGIKEFISLALGLEPLILRAKEEKVLCPEHGVINSEYPWAYKNACYTKVFDKEVTTLSQKNKISEVAIYMGITFETAKECIQRVLDMANPDASGRSERLESVIYRPEFWNKKFKEEY